MLSRVGDESMTTGLVTALRESCGYLRDAGYRETARLLVAAADEIEALRARLQAFEATPRETPDSGREPESKCLVQRVDGDTGVLPPARRSTANR